MNFQTLRAFYTIARCGKLTAAARQLNLTQSALSRLVRQMEEETGVPLFEHRPNRIALNQNGRKFLSMTEQVLGLYDNCLKEIKEDNELFSRTLTIALSAAGSSLPYLIHAFKKRHPQAWFSLKAYDHTKIDPDVQFCFFCSVLPIKDSEAVCLAREPLYLTVSATSSLAGRSGISLSELSSRNFLFADAHNDMQEIQMYYCRMAGFTPEMDNVIERQNILMMLLELGMGVSLLPRINNPNLVQIPIQDIPCTRLIYMKRNPQMYETQLARQFEAFSRQFFQEFTLWELGEIEDPSGFLA